MRILHAARALFVEGGYVTTTTADIARRATVSEGIVFHHFGSKAALLEAAAADYGRGLAQAMFAAGPAPGEAPSARKMLRRAFEYVRRNGALARLLDVSAVPSDSAAARRAGQAEIVAALARGYQTWSHQGLMRAMDPQIVAELTYALVETALKECFVHGDGSRESDYLREAVRCVEGALQLGKPKAGSKMPRSAAPTRAAVRKANRLR